MKKQYNQNQSAVMKLHEIGELAKGYHDILNQAPNWEHIREWGGFLIWGDHYAASKKLLFGINPAKSEEGEFHVELLEVNGPWDPNIDINSPYCRNCNYFFGSDDYLNRWISDTTSTFLVPWGSKNKSQLYSLKQWDEIYRFSREITRKTVEHHIMIEPREERLIVILAGSTCMDLFKEFLNVTTEIEWKMPVEVGNRICANNNQFQWGVMRTSEMTVFQIPHFSLGSTSLKCLRECAKWLSREIRSES